MSAAAASVHAARVCPSEQTEWRCPPRAPPSGPASGLGSEIRGDRQLQVGEIGADDRITSSS